MTTIFYTANLRGNLQQLPRLYTLLRQLREEAAPQKTLLLDLGNSCALEVWHCAATGGRSALLVLDAMGYQAANVVGLLTEDARERLSGSVLTLALVDEGMEWQEEGIIVTVGDALHRPDMLQIKLLQASETRLQEGVLELGSVKGGQVGTAQIVLEDKPRLITHEVLDVPAETLPDPTIAATVDFVLDEARYFQRRHASDAKA
jgi:hypothetical protein